MRQYTRVRGAAAGFAVAAALVAVAALGRPAGGADEKAEPSAKGKDGGRGKTTYDQVSPALVGQVSFEEMMAKDKAAKKEIVDRQMALLKERYDLTARPHESVKMTRGKAIPVGPTARLPEGTTFEKLAEMSAGDIRDKD